MALTSATWATKMIVGFSGFLSMNAFRIDSHLRAEVLSTYFPQWLLHGFKDSEGSSICQKHGALQSPPQPYTHRDCHFQNNSMCSRLKLQCGDEILRFKGLCLPAAKSFAEKLHRFYWFYSSISIKQKWFLQHTSIPSPRITMDNQQYQQ